MTGNEAWFSTITTNGATGSVTFGDGRHTKVKGKGTIIIPGLNKIDDVLLVEGLHANLLSVSQLADTYENVIFNKNMCMVFNHENKNVIMGAREKDDCYHINSSSYIELQNCLISNTSEGLVNLWHRRLGHVNFQDLINLSKKGLVRGVPKLSNKPDGLCEGCKLGKQTRAPHPAVNSLTTSQPLQLLHMDLVGPARNASLGGKTYILVVVDDYTRYTWVKFLRSKDETFQVCKILFKQITIEKLHVGFTMVRVRTDNGTEFKNKEFQEYYEKHGISHEFSSPITPQQNGVAERKN